MAVGDLTVTIVGSYNNMGSAILAMNGQNDALSTDEHKLIIEPVGLGTSQYRFYTYKYARETSSTEYGSVYLANSSLTTSGSSYVTNTIDVLGSVQLQPGTSIIGSVHTGVGSFE